MLTDKDRKLLDTIHRTFCKKSISGDRWGPQGNLLPRKLTEILAEWVPSTGNSELVELPLLDHPLHGLIRTSQQPLSPTSRITQNSFQFLGHCLNTALVCYRAPDGKKVEPSIREMQILFRLAVRLLEVDMEAGVESRSIRDCICSFLSDEIFLPGHDHMPEDIRRFAFHQLVLYWWAVPQKYKDLLFDVHRRFAPGLEGDVILAASEAARYIYYIGATRQRRDDRPSIRTAVTTYHSVKGGTGKSTLAIAHAIKLAQSRTKRGKNAKNVAILDLDLLNPSLLSMRVFAKVKDLRFLESVLTSTRQPDPDNDDMEHLFVQHEKLPLLFGSVFGPGRERQLISTMLNTDIEAWRIVADNLRAMIEFLVSRRGCTHVILDNSSGFLGIAIPSAIVAAENKGTFVLVSTLDAFDIGNIPINQAAFDALFAGQKRVLVLNRLHPEEYERYDKGDPTDVFVLGWREALTRAGRNCVVDVSPRNLRLGRVGKYGAPEPASLFLNIGAMFTERGRWQVKTIRESRNLASLWRIGQEEPQSVVLTDPSTIVDTPEIERFLTFMLNDRE